MARRRTIPFEGAPASAPPPGAGLPWLDALREDARERIAGGLPGTGMEAWKYTDLTPLASLDFAPPAPAEGAPAPPRCAFDGIEGPCLLFVNGRFAPALSSLDGVPAGMRLAGLAETLTETPALLEDRFCDAAPLDGCAMNAFNAAFAADGCVVDMPAGLDLERPVTLRFVSNPGARPHAAHPRVLVRLGAGSRLDLIESHEGPDGCASWSNPVVEVRVGENAVLRHTKLQVEGADAYHTALTEAAVERGGRYQSVLLALGARLSRNEIRVRFEGEGGECRLDGGYMMRGRQHVDNTTLIDHAVPGCASRETYKGVLDERARGVFQGRIVVREGAQKTDGHQLCRTLLLSGEAEIDAKPELEIYADDVKCSHGATTGELEPDQLFYLRSRGLDVAAARALIVEGFMGALLEDVSHRAVREALASQVAAWVQSGAREGTS